MNELVFTIMLPYQEPRENIFSAEQINNLSALGDVFKRIRVRLKGEGYLVENGKIYKKSDTINTNETGENGCG